MSAIVSVAAFGSTTTAIQLLLLRRLMQRRKRGWEYINSMGSIVPPGSSFSLSTLFCYFLGPHKDKGLHWMMKFPTEDSQMGS